MAARAGVHGGNQLEFGRKLRLPGGSRNMDRAGFQWFAQGFEHFTVELGQLVEKKNAFMSEGNFAGSRRIATANQRYRRGGMVRRAEWTAGKVLRTELPDQ